MLKIKRKLASFVLAGIMALSVSLSAVAVEVPEGVEVEHYYTDGHEHDYNNLESGNELQIMATSGCPHHMQWVNWSKTTEEKHTDSTLSPCYITITTMLKQFVCTYSCGYKIGLPQEYKSTKVHSSEICKNNLFA